ncbi:hypothetical protein EDB86DRAFT_2039158 [Lactarius hatsudake]|nr:hypothetical protein EDB86DRAFT_2039158 [Lactarius hatsudake]
MFRHYLRARYGLHRFARLTFLPVHVRDVPEHTNKHHPTESTQAPTPPQRIIVTTPQGFEPHGPRLARQQGQSALIPLSLVLAPSRRCGRCVARLAGAPHFAALVRMLTPRARPVLRAYAGIGAPLYARALGADAELLAAGPGTLTHLTQLADTHSSTNFLAAPARARLTHLALPHFVGVPPAAHDVPPAAVPRIAVLDSSPGYVAALAPGRPLRRVMLRIASCTTACTPRRCSARSAAH